MKKTLLILLIFNCFFLSSYAQSEKLLLEKKEKRIQKRFIDPKSRFVALSAGWGLTATIVSDPNNFLTEGVSMMNNTSFPSIMYEHGIKNNFFGEVGYSYTGHGITVKRLVDGIGSSFYVGIYQSHDFHLGVGYRLIGKNNFHFLNVHAGFFTGRLSNQTPNIPDNIGIGMRDQGIEYQVNIVINRFNEHAFGPYLGLSKEIRIINRIRLFGKYTQRFGINRTIAGDLVLSSDQIDFLNEPANFKVRGGGAFLTLGIKFLIFTDDVE
ncbi:MAG: hypothetical protein AB8B72_06430 [Crocinitomicaceae bacterium]